jgi:hypothetical protein
MNQGKPVPITFVCKLPPSGDFTVARPCKLPITGRIRGKTIFKVLNSGVLDPGLFLEQDPGLRFAPPWAEVYHAVGVLLRSELLKLP